MSTPTLTATPRIDLITLLNHTDFFGGMSERSKREIAAIALPKTVEKGAQLFREGDKGLAVYLLAVGAVQMQKGTPGGKAVVIKTIQPGEVFAEVILFEQDRYPVTATAVKKSLVYSLPKHQFTCLLGIEEFRTDFIKLLMRKQRYLAEKIGTIVSQEVDERFFTHLREHHGPRGRIVPGISKKDLAAAIGTTPETLSRLIQRLKDEGVMVWEGKEIVFKEGFWDTRPG